MELSIEEVLRRLLLLGLPLVPLGCANSDLRGPADAGGYDVTGAGGSTGGADGSAGGAGGGVGFDAGGHPCAGPFDISQVVVRTAANHAIWDACADSGNCEALCESLAPAGVEECERAGPGRDAAASGDANDDGATTADAASGSLDAASDSSIRLHLLETNPSCFGRRPEGMRPSTPSTRGSAAGRWLARAAELEAASIPAFRRLARELSAHGAPPRLVGAARAAIAEEASHYRLMSRAARARHARPRPGRVRSTGIRPLAAVVRENAREGCVRETYGALLAAFQASRARDAELRAALRIIARDEARHARLAWEIDAWARGVLPAAERARVDDARRDEGALFVAANAAATTEPAVAAELGLPSERASADLARRAQRALWTH